MNSIFLAIAIMLIMSIDARSDLIYYDNYEENRKAFLELSQGYTMTSWPLLSDESLTTDLTFVKNNSVDSVVVFSSGLHGIEGYVGSSVQRWLLTEIKSRKNLKSDFLLIHALNPWGMKHKRRVNENNIDLNRNFSNEPNLYSQTNEDYLRLNSFLNPTVKLEIGGLHRLSFIFQAVKLIFQNSIEIIRKSILVGQYIQPKGIYFGGAQAQQQKKSIDQLLQKELKAYKKILWIDIHTGYGERAKLHLLAKESTSESGKKLQRLFPETKIDFGDHKNFYKAHGDLASYLITQSTPQQEINAIAFEYGTMNSQKTLGSIESLRRMVIENQGFQAGYEDSESQQTAKKLFEEMFFPQSEEWKKAMLEQTQALVKPLL